MHSKIIIITTGSRGDLQPFLPIAKSLQLRGYEVTIATNPNHKSLVLGIGGNFAKIPGDIEAIFHTKRGKTEIEDGAVAVDFISTSLRKQQMLEGLKAAQGHDLIICNPASLWVYHIAEKLQIKVVMLSPIPILETRKFPFINFHKETKKHISTIGGVFNLLTYRLVEFYFWNKNRKVENEFRRENGLDALPFFGARYRKQPLELLRAPMIIHTYSRHLIPRPTDWPENGIQTGFLNLVAKHYQPSTSLSKFLEGEPKPIYIGFGSMVHHFKDRLAAAIDYIISKTNWRIILDPGWMKLTPTSSNRIEIVNNVPHTWLFPQMSCLVHHGGAGTVGTALQSGTPSLIIPFTGDQPTWAKLLYNQNLSTKPLPIKELTSELLNDRISQTLEDETLKLNCKSLARKLDAEDPINETVNLIEGYLV